MSDTNALGLAQQTGLAQQRGAADAAALFNADSIARFLSGPTSGPAQDGPGEASPVDQKKLNASAALLTQVFADNDVRDDKVAALRQAIAAGTYNVSAAAVADRLLSVMMRS